MHTPTQLIQDFTSGDQSALNRLFEMIYEELYSVAHRHRNRWNGLDTLDTTALIHETYLKLWRNQPERIENRRHFLALASRAMRQILINYAEKEAAQKRGGEHEVISSNDLQIAGEQTAGDLLDVNAALEKLTKVNERQSQVFECRFFGGLTVDDTAFALGVSPATVKRDWQAACRWIYLRAGNQLSG